MTIAVALLSSYYVGDRVQGVFPADTGFFRSAGIYGTAVATMGMLMSAAYILAMDTFGPITDNAGGIVEMSNQPESVRATTDALDSAGNTTKALTKGYAIGTAALAAFLLFSAYLQEVKRFGGAALQTQVVDLANPRVFVGGLIGAALVFVFASLAMRAVGKAASAMIEEVRRQFRNDPGIMAGTSTPDYASCVDIAVRASLREMIAPGLLAVTVPILVGLILRWEGAAGFLMIGTIAGISTCQRAQQRRWRLGQRQEDDRGRACQRLQRSCSRQGHRNTCRFRRWRHRRRSLERYRRTVDSRLDQVDGHDHPGDGIALHLETAIGRQLTTAVRSGRATANARPPGTGR